MKKYRFQGKIEAGDGGGAFVFFPYDVEKEFGTKGKVPVQATFNGVPYRGSLIKYGFPSHMLPMLKAIREATGTGLGDTVTVELWKDGVERILEIPEDLQNAMEQGGVRPLFDRLSYTHRREYCRWISSAKREGTRRTRLEKAIALLKNGIKTPDAPEARLSPPGLLNSSKP